GSYIIYTPIFSVLILKKKPYKSSIIGVLLAFIGLLVMTLRWNLNLSVGELYLILNAIFLALHIIYVDKLSRVYNLFVLVFIQFLTMTILFYISLILSGGPIIKIDYSPYAIFSVTYTAVFASVAAYLVQIGLQRYTTPTKTAVLFAAEPLSAPFFSYFIIGEVLQVKQYIGALLIIVGILVSEIGSAKRKKVE
ncbi:MAG: DMT family transporter, partial [Deferribacterota bacterium]|nr:DMT family transporter [Deferribacterota bacterium]